MANSGRVLRVLAALAVAIASSAADAASGDSFEDDPAGLISSRSALSLYSAGEHDWQVWVCNVPGGSLPVTPRGSAEVLTNYVTPYFEWLSEGAYTPTFTPEGVVSAERNQCLSEVVKAATDTGATGAIVVSNESRDGGLSQPGSWCPGTSCPGLSTTYPANSRSVLLEGEAIFGGDPRLLAAAHEIGHTFHLGHSSTGTTTGAWADYDNRLDVLSGGTGDRRELIGTLAINRYAAGWIEPSQIRLVQAGDTVSLSPIGSNGTQLAAMKLDPGVAIVLDVRVRSGYDSSLDGEAEGVTVHVLDETTDACPITSCVGLNRRIRALQGTAYGFSHVLDVGQSMEITPGVVVAVTGRNGDTFSVSFGDDSPPWWPDGSELSVSGNTLLWPSALDDGQKISYEVVTPVSRYMVDSTATSVSGLPRGALSVLEVTPYDGAGNRGRTLAISVQSLPAGSGLAAHDPTTGKWTFLHSNGALKEIFFGVPGDRPMLCDWNGDGIDTVGLYRQSDGYLYLRNSNTTGFADLVMYYGIREDVPLCGDWNGDGSDSIGIYRPSEQRFYLRNSNTQGFADVSIVYGNDGDLPYAGDWNGDGRDEIAVHRVSNGMFYTAGDSWLLGQSDRRWVVVNNTDDGRDVLFDMGAIAHPYQVLGTVSGGVFGQAGTTVLAGSW
ncbi:MAG: hypothetical protein KJO36_06905 [Acidimicrobiia bacterium]|nr:hypothetical protein [Acidimicrobiia bacterium]